MKALDRKLLRDLLHMWGQAAAIALVISGGVATLVMSLSTLDSLYTTREAYYRDYRFADAFASLKRAPESLKARVSEIPGVGAVETRVVAAVNVDVEGFPEPIVGRIISVPDRGEPHLNALFLRRGRMIEAGSDEVIINEAFADAHGLKPGDGIKAVINGRKKALTIAGVALSPEYVYQIAPGAIFPDFERYAVMWMGRTPLGNAYDMEGAFNDVVVSITKDSNVEDVLERLDVLLEPYGGAGSYGRDDQTSHKFLSEELKQLGTLAAVFPVIFLGVAAFLLNIVLNRLIRTQRDEIAVLKAFGYGNISIGAHYLKLVLIVTLLGVAAGVALGVWFGKGLSSVYTEFYRFPFLRYELRPGVMAAATLVSTLSAAIGTVHAVYSAAKLPPAEAMRPEAPAVYRETFIERVGLKRLFSQPARMIARHIGRHPVKSLLTVTGIAFACGILTVGRFQGDAINYMVGVQFGMSQREDITVTFVEPASRGALHELKSMMGVEHGEAFRTVPVRLKFMHRSFRTVITGIEPLGDLRRVLDAGLKPIEPPGEGIVLTDHLGKVLGLRPGDTVTVEVLEGSRPVREVKVAGFVKEFMGVAGYMELKSLNRLMREGDAISGVYLASDSLYERDIYRELKETPRVAGIVIHRKAIESFYETMAETILFFSFVSTLLGGSIAFGVVYNSARIALSERGRELASLRVLGFTRGEISYILLGELAVLTLAAIPLGFLIGMGLCWYLVQRLQTDLYRVPLVLEADTYAFAAAVVIVSSIISGLIVKRRLDSLDLVAVLKTRE